jgi:hypothetical protein
LSGVIEREIDEKGEWTRQAIDVMTAWASPDEGQYFTASRVAAYAGSDPEGAMKLTVGFINLTGILLLRLREECGDDLQELLQDAAQVTLQ